MFSILDPISKYGKSGYSNAEVITYLMQKKSLLTIFILFIEDEEVLSKFFFNVTFFVIYGENYWGSMQQIPSLQFLHTRQ